MLVINAMQMLIAGILSTVGALLFGMPPTEVSIQALLSALYLIAISTCLAFLLQTAAQKYTSASSASLILSMEALFASIFSFFLLHEEISPMMMLGGVLILGSILLVEYRRPTKRPESTETAKGEQYTVLGDENADLHNQSELLSVREGACESDR